MAESSVAAAVFALVLLLSTVVLGALVIHFLRALNRFLFCRRERLVQSEAGMPSDAYGSVYQLYKR